MADLWDRLPQPLQEVWERLDRRQKLVIVSVSILALVALIFLSLWVRRPEYGVLYSKLELQEAGTIVEKLKELKVPYRLDQGGSAILVPSRQIHELRLSFAAEGLPRSGEIGYEIFDRTNLGMSDFVQKVNYQRALEGELSRTIQQMEEVEQARVHIVIPEPRLFKEDQKKATASIVLKLRPGTALSPTQVQGITYLVASSVEGLKPEDITMVDSYGNILSDNRDKESFLGLTATQLKLKNEVEAYLERKAQTMLDGVLGPGNSLTRISAELNFEQIERTREIYDPDALAIRSEERREETSYNGDGEGPSSQEHTITNYEVNRTVERIVNTVGNISRLSIAVLVNGRHEMVTGPDGVEQQQYIPRSPEEIARLAQIVKNAVGFDEQRSDRIEVTDFAFDTSYLEREREQMEREQRHQFWFSVVQKAVLGLSFLAIFIFLRSLARRVSQKPPPVEVVPVAPSAEVEAEPEIEVEDKLRKELEKRSAEAKRFYVLQEEIEGYVRKKPADIANLLRTWLLEV